MKENLECLADERDDDGPVCNAQQDPRREADSVETNPIGAHVMGWWAIRTK